MSIEFDMSKLITADAKATEAKALRASAIKGECATRISDILDGNTMTNLQSAAIVGLLSGAEMDLFRSAQLWISTMLTAARTAIAEGGEPIWPESPDGLAALVAKF